VVHARVEGGGSHTGREPDGVEPFVQAGRRVRDGGAVLVDRSGIEKA
jgi:hypothetical protein